MLIKRFSDVSGEEELKRYSKEGGKRYTPIMNILMGGRLRKSAGEPNWYSRIGEFIVNTIKPLPPNLRFLLDNDNPTQFPSDEHKRNLDLGNIAIFFLTSNLNSKSLLRMWGEPLYHDNFGEGFDGDYDEETDTTAEPEITFNFASYFVEVDGVKFHIGYDNRGTVFEVNPETLDRECSKRRIGNGEMLFECLKSIIEQYQKTKAPEL